MRPKGTPQQLEDRRRRALVLLEQGFGVQEVADRVGVSRISVSAWKKAAALDPNGVAAKPKAPPPSKLSDAQFDQLRQWLIDGPLACGFDTDLWTCPRVAQLIRDRLGVSYHVDHLSRLLRKLGFTPQKPNRRAAERDEPAIRNWVRRDWPRIKKKRSG
jgi:transposase